MVIVVMVGEGAMILRVEVKGLTKVALGTYDEDGTGGGGGGGANGLRSNPYQCVMKAGS